MNKVQLIGNIGSEPKLIETQNGKKAVSFSLATTEKYKDKNGQDSELTTWHNITGWGWIANKPFQKGQRVFVTGKISNRSYQDKDGNTKYISEIVADYADVFAKLVKMPELPTPAQQAFDQHSDISQSETLPF